MVSGCSPAPEQPLRIGTNVWPGYEPLYLARELGEYHDGPVHLIEMGSATAVIRALQNHSLEGATLTLDEALSAMAKGVSLKVVAILDFSEGGDALVAKPEIESLSALRGKRIVVEDSATGAILLDAALMAGELTAADIKIVSRSADEHVASWDSADAVVCFEPALSKLLAEGGHVLFDSHQTPERIVDVLVVTAEATVQQPEAIRGLLSGYYKARRYLREHPREAARHMAGRMKLSPDDVLASFRGLRLPTLSESRDLLSGSPSALEQGAEQLMLFMLERWLLRSEVNTAGLGSPQFLPAPQAP